MSYSNTILRQILSFLPKNEFEKAVKKHESDKYVKSFSSYQLLIVHLYAQIAGKESLRDIETGLSANENKLYHIGLSKVSRSNLSYANKRRDYEIFETLFYALLSRCDRNARSGKFRFKNKLYALDSTLIDLCLSLFPWAQYRTRKGAIKMHHLMDIKSGDPVFLVMSEGKRHDITIAKSMPLPISSDSIIVFDRGYNDFEWFNTLEKQHVFFVTRAKSNLSYRVLGQHSVNESKSIMSDEVIELTVERSREEYPGQLRLVTFYDDKNDKILRFLTNNFKLAASTIARIFNSRWDIEKFFRWIKQNLNIKTFLGTTKNAVMLQIWAAMIYYLILSYIKFQTKLAWSLTELSRRIRATLFENIHLLDLMSYNFKSPAKLDGYAVQLNLF